MERKRRILSILLLAVFLPAFIASSIHTHPSADSGTEECIQCEHHLPHAGHLSNATAGISHCILCHFLALPFVAAVLTAVLIFARKIGSPSTAATLVALLFYPEAIRSRAPPALVFTEA